MKHRGRRCDRQPPPASRSTERHSFASSRDRRSTSTPFLRVWRQPQPSATKRTPPGAETRRAAAELCSSARKRSPKPGPGRTLTSKCGTRRRASWNAPPVRRRSVREVLIAQADPPVTIRNRARIPRTRGPMSTHAWSLTRSGVRRGGRYGAPSNARSPGAAGVREVTVHSTLRRRRRDIRFARPCHSVGGRRGRHRSAEVGWSATCGTVSEFARLLPGRGRPVVVNAVVEVSREGNPDRHHP